MDHVAGRSSRGSGSGASDRIELCSAGDRRDGNTQAGFYRSLGEEDVSVFM